MSDTSHLITARELAEMLAPYGDLPVKLRCEPEAGDGDFFGITLIERKAVDVCVKNGQDTDFGDISLCRLTVRVVDNA
ncbi:hypothetical protein E6C67_08505 [Azospirillum sp. TSA2s]|uniref:hypothetical protein n=1 Tax=Azospirillum sp. TSA2s TaxID=709810 RepID=UPI0010AA259F|nr:hypothetical protein [Azospirillum sp. TSA2s]QCG93979.1 hypothetical protein E6C67_08505 [Azospirillum sp. TSA2s]